MKKFFATVLTLAMALSLVACGGGEKPAASTPAASTPAASAPAEGAPVGDPKEIVVSHTYASDHNVSQAFELFKEFVEKESGGSMTVAHHPNSALGGDEDAMEMMAYGTVTMMVPSVASLEMYAGDWGILSLAYIFPSVDKAFEAVDGELGDFLKATLDGTEFICLGFNSNGTRNMTNNVRPITCLDDLKGIKMRVMNSQTYVDWMNALGANATPMGFNEVFTSLQQGTIDGQENGAANAYTSGFQEVQKYFSVTEHVYDMNAILMNRAFYEDLNEAEKAIIDEGVQTYLMDWQRQTEVDQDGEFIAKWEDAGVQVNYVEESEKQAFRDAMADMHAAAKAKFPEAWAALEKYQ